VFYNSTVELVEKPSEALGARRVFTYILALAAAGLVGYFAFGALTSKSSGSTERGTRVDASTAAASWVPDKVYSQSAKSRVAGRRRDKAPKAAAAASPKAAAASDD